LFVYRSWGLRRLLPWILSWGTLARVVSPAEVVARVRREAEALVQTYADA
jgi:predicted DNA-binding transcriptional regulator YafY